MIYCHHQVKEINHEINFNVVLFIFTFVSVCDNTGLNEQYDDKE